MNGFRAHRIDHRDGRAVPHLHSVSRVAPPRPRWSHLYLVLALVGAAGTGAHVMASNPTVREIATIALGATLFGILAVWVRVNRMTLTRLDEPDAGTGQPRVRIVRSRKLPAWGDDHIAQIDPDDRVILPYDFR